MFRRGSLIEMEIWKEKHRVYRRLTKHQLFQRKSRLQTLLKSMQSILIPYKRQNLYSEHLRIQKDQQSTLKERNSFSSKELPEQLQILISAGKAIIQKALKKSMS